MGAPVDGTRTKLRCLLLAGGGALATLVIVFAVLLGWLGWLCAKAYVEEERY